MDSIEKTSYIRPLFWQHGESKELLLDEIENMYQNGIGGFIVESRPHPDYLSYGWWRDLDIIIKAAKERHMEVWLFDDSSFPSGAGAQKIITLYPELMKYYLAEHHLDIIGPKNSVTLNVAAWVEENKAKGIQSLETSEEELLYVLLAKRKNGKESLDETSIMNLTSHIREGKLIMDIPEGMWRLFIITKTRNGGEIRTKDYINPLSKQAVRQYIDIIYEEHYKRYKEEFGKTIKGFFTDEPRFGNVAGYEDIMWKTGVVYPYTDDLIEALSQNLGKEFTCYLPFLWSNEDEVCQDIHYCYMDTVSKMFSNNYIKQVREWCACHQVKLTGHLIEDNGVHARLGYGCGHFFRVMEEMDSAGMDIVYQIWPHYTEGRFTTPLGYLDCEFFYWGLSKMASSAAHIDPKKEGVALCEIFGAYGWQMGLRLMKWLTDHVCVRGINLLIPHAFSPKYPDSDCPPHFYARGKNPQWRYFHLWAEYANRVCERLSNGMNHATIAVVYHAEAEWGGKYEPFEKVVKVLAQSQIDCDIVPIDYLIDKRKCEVKEKNLRLNKREYKVLIIPYAQCMSVVFMKTILSFIEQGLPVVLMSDYPEKNYYTSDENLLSALKNSKVQVCQYSNLIKYLKKNGYYDIQLSPPNHMVRCYHYEKQGQQLYFITNEDTMKVAKQSITMPQKGNWIAYDALYDDEYKMESKNNDGYTYDIELAPYQSLFIYLGDNQEKLSRKPIPFMPEGKRINLESKWHITTDKEEATQKIKDITTLQNMASLDLIPYYSGTFYYTTKFSIETVDVAKEIYLDLGEVYEISEVILNGENLGSKIVPPYSYNLTGKVRTQNSLEVRVTNTFVNEKGGKNRFDRAMLQNPSGLLGTVEVIITDTKEKR